jgi:aryl-alcohol dehydrogenase-like predicted oxidoreductase
VSRAIGNTPYRTGRLALGCVTFGREIDEAESFRLLDYAVEHGITLLDTAEAYGGGQARQYRRNVLKVDDVREAGGEMHSSEKIIGRWLRKTGVRSGVIVQTKTLAHRRADVAAAIQASLERLQTDRVDLFLLHRFSDIVPLEETMEPIAEAMRSGAIGAAGCSNTSATQLAGALAARARHGFPRFEVTQPMYSLVAREIEREFLRLCRRENIGVIGYSPLGAGFLSGKYNGTIPAGSRFDVIPGHVDLFFSERNFAIVRNLAGLAERSGIPMVKLAMAWALRNADMTAVLIGARTTVHIDNAIEALHLSGADEYFKEMDQWSDPQFSA